MMTVKPFAILSVATAAALSLAGCGDRVEDHAERTGNAIAADVHAATSNVVDSVDALTGTVANQLDGAAARSLDRAADRLDRASDDLQRDIRGHVDTARDHAGAALEDAGADLRERGRARDDERRRAADEGTR